MGLWHFRDEFQAAYVEEPQVVYLDAVNLVTALFAAIDSHDHYELWGPRPRDVLRRHFLSTISPTGGAALPHRGDRSSACRPWGKAGEPRFDRGRYRPKNSAKVPVFTTSVGTRLLDRNVRRALDAMPKPLDLAWVTPHVFRPSARPDCSAKAARSVR